MSDFTAAAEALGAMLGSPEFITDPCRDGSHDCRFQLCNCPGHKGTPAGQTCTLRPCPLHSECELYLAASACPYRSGEISYEQAEAQAEGPATIGGCDTWASNE